MCVFGESDCHSDACDSQVCFILHNLLVKFGSSPETLSSPTEDGELGTTLSELLHEAGVHTDEELETGNESTVPVTNQKQFLIDAMVMASAEVIDADTHDRLTRALITLHSCRYQ
jgi:hypothetical protein